MCRFNILCVYLQDEKQYHKSEGLKIKGRSAMYKNHPYYEDKMPENIRKMLEMHNYRIGEYDFNRFRC